jgi:hypothetical protein
MEFDIWERMYLIQCSNRLPQTTKMSAYDYKKLLQFLDTIELTEEEEDRVEMKRLSQGRRTWNTDKSFTTDIELSRNNREILDKVVVLMRLGPVPPAPASSLVALADKLGVYDDAERKEDSDV